MCCEIESRNVLKNFKLEIFLLRISELIHFRHQSQSGG